MYMHEDVKKSKTFNLFIIFYFIGDTMTVQDPVSMNLCSAVWAVVSFTVADLEEMLPR